MHKLLHPKWLFILSVLPLGIYLLVAWRSYQFSNGLAIDRRYNDFYIFTEALAGYMATACIWGGVLWRKGRTLTIPIIAFASLAPAFIYMLLGKSYIEDLFDSV